MVITSGTVIHTSLTKHDRAKYPEVDQRGDKPSLTLPILVGILSWETLSRGVVVSELVELKVQAVVVEGVTQPAVLLRDAEGKRSFSILIGPAEAMAISIQLAGEKPQRPLTHDLLRSVLDELSAKVLRVVITELRDSTYFAQISLHTKTGDHIIDSRPSDAIALALRTDSPIFISNELLTQIEGEQTLERQGFVVDSGSETVH